MASHPAFTVMAVNSTIGALLISPLLFTSDLSWLANPRSLGVALHLGIITTALAYGVFTKGLQLVSVYNAATLTLAEPLTAALLGILLVGEKLTPSAFGGILLRFAGLLTLTLNFPKKKRL